MREGRAQAGKPHTWGPRKGRGWDDGLKPDESQVLLQLKHSVLLSLHPHGEIWGARKGLLCKGCGLDFSDASGTAGSATEARPAWGS